MGGARHPILMPSGDAVEMCKPQRTGHWRRVSRGLGARLHVALRMAILCALTLGPAMQAAYAMPPMAVAGATTISTACASAHVSDPRDAEGAPCSHGAKANAPCVNCADRHCTFAPGLAALTAFILPPPPRSPLAARRAPQPASLVLAPDPRPPRA